MKPEHKPLLSYDISSALGVCTNPYQGEYKRVLCVCSAGVLRSPTAAMVLSKTPFNFNTRSCGLEPYALIPLTEVLVAWADQIVCMTSYQEKILKDVTKKPIVNLNIRDSYEYRNEELITMIEQKYEGVGNACETPLCEECGCAGNSSCGHDPLDDEMLCALDEAGFCGCCKVNARKKTKGD